LRRADQLRKQLDNIEQKIADITRVQILHSCGFLDIWLTVEQGEERAGPTKDRRGEEDE
jgi:hypothetical protein